MCAAPRKSINRGLATNLHTHPSGFRYRHPVTRRYIYLGKDRAKANEAAREANAYFIHHTSLVEKIIGPQSVTIASLIETHRREHLSTRDLAPKTLAMYEDYLRRISREAGSLDAANVTTRDLVLLLKRICAGDRSRQVYRTQLIDLFNTAIAEGICENNPAAVLARPKVKRQRQRLTWEGFQAVHACAEPWLQNAMDLGLQTLQRREDLVTLTVEADRGNTLQVQQHKTQTRLAIEVSAPLREVLNRCNDGVKSPFIIHRRPQKLRTKDQRAKGRQHHTQVMPEQLTRAFEDARNRSGYFSCRTDAGTLPTFHEIRSLGAALYRQAGWSTEQVQRLLGHEDEDMTRHYLKGHEAPWDRVPSGLALARNVKVALT